MKDSYEYLCDVRHIPQCNRGCGIDFDVHFHSSLEIVYLFEGEVETVLDDRSYTVHGGQAILISSYVLHSFHTHGFSDGISLTVPLDYLPSVAGLLRNKMFACEVYSVGPDEQELVLFMDTLAKKWKTLRPEIIRGYTYVILFSFIQQAGLTAYRADANSDLVKDILAYLEEVYTSPVSMDSIVKHFNYSRSRFSYVFNSRMGCSITDYLNARRCRRVAGLLTETEISVTEAAMSSGFENMCTFNRAFKKYFQMTPTQYRQGRRKRLRTH